MPRETFTNLIVAGAAGIAGLSGSYAMAGLTPDFVAGPVAGFLARHTPAAVVTFAIVVLGDLGHQLNLLGALTLSAAGLGTAALFGIQLGNRLDRLLIAPVATAVGGAVVAVAVTQAPLASAVAGFAAGLVIAVAELAPVERMTGVSTDRRRVVSGVGSAAVLGLVGFILGSRGDPHGATMNADVNLEDENIEMSVNDLLTEANEKSIDVEGLEPLVSDEFYEVDINSVNPTVNEETWELSVTGAVEQEITIDYEEIRMMEAQHQFNTLRCVGESLNGRKMDNAVWTGVPIMRLVEPAGLPEACCVMFKAADGFFEEFPLPALEDGFLAYGMNGQVLPRGHGYPARALIPGHWGEINVKWITEIEILEEEAKGYWERRGWHGTGPVNTVAKLHVDNRLADGRMEVAGHAYAGIRGIREVEVSTDGGETWAEAELSEPLSGEDVWRQWVHRYEPPNDVHEVVVRATDGTGEVQPKERAKAFPNGATGWVSKEFRP